MKQYLCKKRRIFFSITFSILMIFLFFLPLSCTTVYAEEPETESYSKDDFDQQLQDSGGKNLIDKLTETPRNALDDLGVDEVSPNKILGLKVTDFLKTAFNLFKKELKTPVITLVSVLGIVLLCSLINGLKSTFSEKTMSSLFHLIATLCVALTIIAPIMECIKQAAAAIRDCSNYIVSFIPVFAGVMTASGQAASAVTYNMVLFSVVQIISKIASTNLVPLMAIYLAFCIISAATPDFKLSGVSEMIKKTVYFALSIMTTIFVGMLTLQGFISASADNVATKTAKLVMGSFIPIVGGALSDALNSVRGCMGILKTSVGAFSILAVVFNFLPVIFKCLAWILTLNISSAVADMFEIKQISDIFKSTVSVISVLNAIMLSFALIVIISTALMIMLGSNM